MWITQLLSQVANVVPGNSVPAKQKDELYAGVEGMPYIATKDIGFDGIIDYQNGICIPKNYLNKFKISPIGATLVCAEGGSAGRKIAYSLNECCYVNKLVSFQPNSKIIPKFLYYYVLSDEFQLQFRDALHGLIGGVSLSKMKNFNISYPPLAEQQRIVAKLDAAFAEIDAAIDAAGKSGEKLKEQQTLHTETIFNETCSPFKKIVLGDVCDGVQYGTSSKCSKTGKYPVLRMGNIQNGTFDVSDLVYLDDEIEAKKYKLNKGDVLFNRTNSSVHVGKTGVFDEVDDYLFAGYLIKVNYLKEKVIPEFLSYYLNSRKIREYGFSVMSESINQSNINGTKLKNYPFYEVPLEAQKSATQKILVLNRASDEAINLYGKKVKALIKLKSALLATELQSEAA